MGFTATPPDGSPSPVPMPVVVPDGTNTPTALEGGPSKSSGGNTLAPVAVYAYDGYDVAEGATTDAAVTGDTAGTTSAKLRGLVKILASVWDSTLGLLAVKLQAATGGGSTPYHLLSAAGTNATSVKASAGNLYGFSLTNTNASTRWVKFYNKASAPNPASDAVVWAIGVPGSTLVMATFPEGLSFTLGVAFATVTGSSDTDNTAVGAGDLSIDLRLK